MSEAAPHAVFIRVFKDQQNAPLLALSASLMKGHLAFDFWKVCGCQLLHHCRFQRLESVGRPDHHLKVNDLACSVKLHDIHAHHAHRANMGAEFEDDRVVANKPPLIGQIFQNAYSGAQVQHRRGLAFSWLPEDR